MRPLETANAQLAMQTARRKEIYETLHPETKHGAIGGGHDQSRKVCNSAQRFTKETAEATGRHERSVGLDAQRGRVLGDDLKLIEGTSLDKGRELDALVKMAPGVEGPAAASRQPSPASPRG